ncbi:MAG: hypothetical protein OXC91_03525 [Rhodobacteraceae bacterium]|nr:hypothetical protein [Paracoccaceae bacterium]
MARLNKKIWGFIDTSMVRQKSRDLLRVVLWHGQTGLAGLTRRSVLYANALVETVRISALRFVRSRHIGKTVGSPEVH